MVPRGESSALSGRKFGNEEEDVLGDVRWSLERGEAGLIVPTLSVDALESSNGNSRILLSDPLPRASQCANLAETGSFMSLGHGASLQLFNLTLIWVLL